MPTYYVKGCSPLALPLGELSPQVTERVLQAGRSTVKVHDESADNPLFVNLYRIFAQNKIP